MTQASYLWMPPPVQSLPVRGKAERLPINRLFFVGRNYHAHAVEMGRPVDKNVERPFYFTKSPQTLVQSGATVAYPPGTQNYHFEMELVVAIGAAGFKVSQADAHKLIYGYACGLDMTRRDLQLAAFMLSSKSETRSPLPLAARVLAVAGRSPFAGHEKAQYLD